MKEKACSQFRSTVVTIFARMMKKMRKSLKHGEINVWYLGRIVIVNEK